MSAGVDVCLERESLLRVANLVDIELAMRQCQLDV